MYTSQNNPMQMMQMAQYLQQMGQMQQSQDQSYMAAGHYTGQAAAGYDYISDNIFGQNSEYSSEDIATLFKALTGQDFTAEQIEEKFGKERIADYDLYAMVEGDTLKDGYLNPAEILSFMANETSADAAFSYLSDDEASYSLEDVAEKIKQQTGKIIDPADLAMLVGGRTEMTDFEVMMLLDRNRDGKADKIEMDSLISGFKIEYDLDDGSTDTTENEVESLYGGDGVWSYSVEDFQDRALEEFNIALTEDEITDVLGNNITDTAIADVIDTNDDGHISTSELNNVFNRTTTEAQDINYIGDDTAFYSSEEVASLLTQATGEAVTATDVETLTGEAVITDQMMFNVFDSDKNGTVEVSEAQSLVDGIGIEESFNYLADEETSYSSEELVAALGKLGVTISIDDVENLFGDSVITDSDILEMLDKTNAETGFKDGRITLEDL